MLRFAKMLKIALSLIKLCRREKKERKYHCFKIRLINPFVNKMNKNKKNTEHNPALNQEVKTDFICDPEFAGAEGAGFSESVQHPRSICSCGNPTATHFPAISGNNL